MKAWKVLHTISRTTSPWLKVVVEAVCDEKGEVLEYWRVEKDDAIVVLPLYRGMIVVPKPFYRHGIGQHTWDLPGGRWDRRVDIKAATLSIIVRELGIEEKDVTGLAPVNRHPWPVNSSFSNQHLHGFVAEISDTAIFPEDRGVERIPADPPGLKNLLDRLCCLQCRCVVLEWCHQRARLP